MYSNILFDLDGTISDNSVGIIRGVKNALNYFKVDYIEDDLYSFIGPPLLDSFMQKYGFSEENALIAIEEYRKYYREHGVLENFVYDGVEQVLKELKESGKKLFVTTAKPEVFAKKILSHFKLDHYFDGIHGATLDSSRIRKEDIIEYTIEDNKLEKRVSIMIGDRHHDIEGARIHGIDSIGVTYGFGSKEELESAGATYIVDDLADVLDIL